MSDLKVLDTRGLLQLLEVPPTVALPGEIIERLDARGRHMFQRHSLYNPDPLDEVVHARSMFKFYDEKTPDGIPTMIHIPRCRWEDMPDWFG